MTRVSRGGGSGSTLSSPATAGYPPRCTWRYERPWRRHALDVRSARRGKIGTWLGLVGNCTGRNIVVFSFSVFCLFFHVCILFSLAFDFFKILDLLQY